MSETLYLVGGPDASKSGREFFQTVSMTTCIPETLAISAAKHLYQEELEKELLRLVTTRDDFEGLVVNNGLVELCSCDLSFLLEFPNAHIASIEISPMQENAFELFWEMLSFLARRLNLSIYQAEQDTKIELNDEGRLLLRSALVLMPEGSSGVWGWVKALANEILKKG